MNNICEVWGNQDAYVFNAGLGMIFLGLHAPA